MTDIKIIPMSERKYRNIPVDKIRVLNSRNRDRAQFEKIIRSLKDVGQKKYIIVNERNFSETGYYELVCGQGRYLAHKELGRSHIKAEVVNCTKKRAYLYSLVENIARLRPGTMWFAYEVKRMYDSGLTLDQIGKIVGHSGQYISDYVKLVEQGETRLIKGVERGLFPIRFAMLVARSKDSDMQNILMDAYDQGVVSSGNFSTVHKIIERRANRGKRKETKSEPSSKRPLSDYSVKQLKKDISQVTKEKKAFVNESTMKENRLVTLLHCTDTLTGDPEFMDLLKAEGLGSFPELQGEYNV